MNLERYTEKAQQAVLGAQSAAEQGNYVQVEPEHLLAALVAQADGVVPQILEKLGVAVPQFSAQVGELVSRQPRVYGVALPLNVSSALNRVLAQAEQEAKQMQGEYISTEHLLLALTGGAAKEVTRLLAQRGIDRDAVCRVLTEIRDSQHVASQNPETTYPWLEELTRNL